MAADWNNGDLPARFFVSRKDANGLLLLSTHYPHQAVISTRITRWRLICTDFWNNGYLPARFFSRKGAKAQMGYYCLVLTTHIRQQLAHG